MMGGPDYLLSCMILYCFYWNKANQITSIAPWQTRIDQLEEDEELLELLYLLLQCIILLKQPNRKTTNISAWFLWSLTTPLEGALQLPSILGAKTLHRTGVCISYADTFTYMTTGLWWMFTNQTAAHNRLQKAGQPLPVLMMTTSKTIQVMQHVLIELLLCLCNQKYMKRHQKSCHSRSQ